MKKLILSALVLALSSSAAMADRWHGGGHASGGVVVHSNGGWGRGYNGGEGGRGVIPEHGRDHGRDPWRVGYAGAAHDGWRGEPRYYHNHGYARANIWMPRPEIRTHYYDSGYRPSLLAEDCDVREGYVFVRGSWQWDGYQWIWQSGHYEPDPAFVEVY